MPGKSVIPRHELVPLAHGLAAGRTQPQLMREFGWDTKKMRRCIDRLASEILYEAGRMWQKTVTIALEWLRLRGLCTQTELDALLKMVRERAIDGLEPTLKKGDQYQQSRDFARAERTYLWYLRDDPQNTDVLIEYGLCLVSMNRMGEALHRFNAALSVAPDDARGRFGRAIALWRTGSYGAARADLERAHELEPSDLFYRTVLTKWRLRWPAERSAAVMALKDVMVRLRRQQAENTADIQYCRQIAGMVFSALWAQGLLEEASEAGKMSQELGWSSARTDETLRLYALQQANVLHSFRAQVLARADGQPEHWPDDTEGYTIRLSIAARDANEARALALDYLHSTEPPIIRFTIDLRPSPDKLDTCSSPGVSQNGPREWNRRPEQKPVQPEPVMSRRYPRAVRADRSLRRPGDPHRRRYPRH